MRNILLNLHKGISVSKLIATLVLIAGAYSTANASLSITMQPQSITVAPGNNPSFFVSATGSGPLSYFWLRAGVTVSGVVGPVYTITNAQVTNSGTLISCVVSNSSTGETQASSNALLYVSSKPIKIALVNPDNYRVLKCGENPDGGGYYSVANGTITTSSGNWDQTVVTNSANWAGLGQSSDFLTTLLTNAGYEVDVYWSSNSPNLLSGNYNLVIVQDPLNQVGQFFGPVSQTNVPDTIYNQMNPAFLNNLGQYYSSGGAVLLVGNAVRLLENGTNRLSYGKQVVGQNVPHSVTGASTVIPSQWLFVQGAPFCCSYRSGSGTETVQQSSIVPAGSPVSQISLANGMDDYVGLAWCETIYSPTDAVSLLDVTESGSANYTLNGTTCSPTVYSDTVLYTNRDLMGYTTVNGRRIYFIGSDAYFNLSFTDYQGSWHCSSSKTIGNSIASSGTNAVLGLISQLVTAGFDVAHAAAATPTMTNGFVVGASIIDPGAGYTNSPQIRFIGGSGSGAQATAIVSNGMVIGLTINNPGSGYSTPPIIVISPPFVPKPVLNIATYSQLSFTNLSVGTNYQLQLFVAGDLSNVGLPFTATNSSYVQFIPGIVASNAYRLAKTPVPVQAQATAQVSGGFVIGFTVNNGGSGYPAPPTAPPVVTIIDTGGGGSNATASASVSPAGVVTNISVVSPGIGYSSGANVIIAPPPAVVLSPYSVTQVMQLNMGSFSPLSSLSPYDNYQLLYASAPQGPWSNLGGVFVPTAATATQFINLTGNPGFYRLEHLP